MFSLVVAIAVVVVCIRVAVIGVIPVVLFVGMVVRVVVVFVGDILRCWCGYCVILGLVLMLLLLL